MSNLVIYIEISSTMELQIHQIKSTYLSECDDDMETKRKRQIVKDMLGSPCSFPAFNSCAESCCFVLTRCLGISLYVYL